MSEGASSSAVIVGASSGVGRALLRALAERGSRLVIAARDSEDLEACALDARVRYGAACSPVAFDMGDPTFDVEGFAASCFAELGGVDYLLVPAGGARPGDLGASEAAVRPVLDGNFTGPARLAAAFGHRMAQRGRGHIVLFSSIAASAPRTKNMAYSAAKAALETYARGLRHALASAGVEVLVVVLGYVDTPQSFGEALRFPVAKPEAVANDVLRRVFRRQGGRMHYPRFWWWITTVLRYTPFWLYRRLKF